VIAAGWPNLGADRSNVAANHTIIGADSADVGVDRTEVGVDWTNIVVDWTNIVVDWTKVDADPPCHPERSACPERSRGEGSTVRLSKDQLLAKDLRSNPHSPRAKIAPFAQESVF
jgi:hypothetical protein